MSLFVKSTGILTEHLGYMPIAVIDDIINAVNDILYKCTAAMEQFLSKRYGQSRVVQVPGKRRAFTVPDEDIEVGTAKLETLLESVVDKNFEKFELYVLRNLLTIPEELISEGWIRLSHHEGIDFTNHDSSSGPLDDQIDELEQQLYFETKLGSILNQELSQARSLQATLDKMESAIPLLFSPPAVSQELKDKVLFVASQASMIGAGIQDIAAQEQAPSGRWNPSTSARELYLDTFVHKIVDSLGVPTTGYADRKTEQDAANAVLTASYLGS